MIGHRHYNRQAMDDYRYLYNMLVTVYGAAMHTEKAAIHSYTEKALYVR